MKYQRTIIAIQQLNTYQTISISNSQYETLFRKKSVEKFRSRSDTCFSSRASCYRGTHYYLPRDYLSALSSYRFNIED